MRRIAIIALWAGLATGVPVHGWAAVCTVTTDADTVTPGSLRYWLAEIQSRAACRVADPAIRARYQEFAGTAQAFFLIRFPRSMDIPLVTKLPALHGHGGLPLILQVDDGATVRLVGTQLSADAAVELGGSGGPVIVDGLVLTQFPGTALTITSDDNALLRTRVLYSATSQPSPATTTWRTPPADRLTRIPGVLIRGRRTTLHEVEVANHGGTGVLISESLGGATCPPLGLRLGSQTRIRQSRIHHNAGDGLIIQAAGTVVEASSVHHNAGDGVYVHGMSDEARCTAPGSLMPAMWHTARITKTHFWQNGGEDGRGIAVSQMPLPPPVDLIAVSPAMAPQLVVKGFVSRFADPAYLWNDTVLDFSALRVELFLGDAGRPGQGILWLADNIIDPATRQFTIHLPLPILFDGRPVAEPVLTATIVDTEYGNTSPFAAPLDVVAALDWDQDGIPNAEEDANHDGVVDGHETDPQLADSDGDGLSDGDERFGSGFVAQRIAEAGLVIGNPHRLDPRNADSDGDCLPDGLEIGFAEPDLPPWDPAPGSLRTRARLALSPLCLTALQDRGILVLANALPWNPTKSMAPDNVTTLFDTDASTATDPTDPDSDHDGLRDGEEDWNLDGARSANPPAAEDAVTMLVQSQPDWRETDPTVADSDGDGLPDGAEGDDNGDRKIGAMESHALSHDTDGDGLGDAEEIRRFGTDPNVCDTDGDGLADGLEAGVVHPDALLAGCRGLQSAGSNFSSIGALNPLKSDSDSDGIDDGAEDANANGWLDQDETDPSTGDTDEDGIPDAVEVTGDLDGDGLVDIDLQYINNGGTCAPPAQVGDLDCDALPNARDPDSDNDGCADREEGLTVDSHGIPASYNAKVKRCGSGAASPTMGSVSTPAAPAVSSDPAPQTSGEPAAHAGFVGKVRGGGSCSLIQY